MQEDNNSIPFVTEDELKPELQQGGLIKEIKDKVMPGTDAMSKLARKEYRKDGDLSPCEIRDNFSDVLQDLMRLETSIYYDKETKVKKAIFSDFFDDYYHRDDLDEYRNIQRVIHRVESQYEQADDFQTFFPNASTQLLSLMAPIEDSISQGRKTRVGSMLENHLEWLLQELGYPVETQIDFEEGSSKIDIVMPNKKTFEKSPENAIFLPCQTTFKDRHRLTLSKLPSGERYEPVEKLIATAGGVNLITDSDDDDLTDEKINEINKEGYKLLVFNEVKEEYPDEEGIVSYNQFINNYLPEDVKDWDIEGEYNTKISNYET